MPFSRISPWCVLPPVLLVMLLAGCSGDSTGIPEPPVEEEPQQVADDPEAITQLDGWGVLYEQDEKGSITEVDFRTSFAAVDFSVLKGLPQVEVVLATGTEVDDGDLARQLS